MISPKQRHWLMKRQPGGLWYDACRFQGWNFTEDYRRHAIYEELHAAGKIKGVRTKDFDNRDFDAVKSRLQFLAFNLQGAIEDDAPDIGESRRLLDVIEEQIKCLAIYPLAEPMGVEKARAYVMEIARDKFDHGRMVDRITLEELSARRSARSIRGKLVEIPSQLEQLMMTVAGRLNGKHGFRATAGHSGHDMRMRAGVPCHCVAICEPHGVIRMQPAAEQSAIKTAMPKPAMAGIEEDAQGNPIW